MIKSSQRETMRQALMVKHRDSAADQCQGRCITPHHFTLMMEVGQRHSRVKLNVLVLIKVWCCGIETCSNALTFSCFCSIFNPFHYKLIVPTNCYCKWFNIGSRPSCGAGLRDKTLLPVLLLLYCVYQYNRIMSYSNPITRINVKNLQFSKTRDKENFVS